MNTHSPSSAQNSSELDSLDSLDQLLAESKPKRPLFDLDDLLADSMQQRKDADAVKLSRSLLSKSGLDPEARKRMEAQVREHEMKVQWSAVAAVGMFSRQWCAECGLCHIQFIGYFQRQTHKTSKIVRWLKSTKQQMDGLPKEAKYEDHEVETCEECAGAAGYPIEEYDEEEEQNALDGFQLTERQAQRELAAAIEGEQA